MAKPTKFSHRPMVFLCSALLLLVPGVTLAQVKSVTNDTSTPIPGAGHDYVEMVNETVDPATGSVSLRIQVPVPKGRGLTIPFAFAYDSNGAHYPAGSNPGFVGWLSNTGFLSSGGWSYAVPLISQVTYQTGWEQPPQPMYYCDYTTDYVFQDVQGGRHSLGLGVIENPNSLACINLIITNQFNSGGDPLVSAYVSNYEEPVLVADADGTVFHFPNPIHHASQSQVVAGLPDYIEDRNGNQVTVTDSGNGAFTFTDTLGRAAFSSSGFGASGNTVSVSGLSTAYTIDWGTASGNFSVGSSRTSDPNCEATIPNYSGSQPVITSISLPNGEQYTFTYESTYGLLSRITYPNGAYVSYTWALNSDSTFGATMDSNYAPQGCEYNYGTPAISTRTVSFNGSTPALEQSFTYSTNWNSPSTSWTTKTTTVQTTDSLRNKEFTTVYTYSPVNQSNPPYDYSLFAMQIPVEQTTTVDDWSGNPLQTVTKSWVNQYEMQGQQVADNGTVTSDQFFVFGAGGQITGKYECGSGQTCYCGSNACATTPARLPTVYTRLTATQYHSFADTPIYASGPSIFDRPASVVISDGGGHKAAETDYGYDGSTLTGTSGVAKHDYTNYSSGYTNRGNATSMSKWLNTSGGPLPWTYTYDDTGQELTMVDPNTNPTGYSYTDAFPTCGSPSQGTNAYLTKITDAKGFTQTFTYRYCDGQLNTATDRNSQITSYTYEASLNRLGSISYPDGGSTSYGYGSSGACAQPSSTTMLIQSGSNYTETATMDGVCHVTQTAITSDPVGWDYTATTYDGMGKVWTVSDLYRSTNDPTYGLTTYTYDAIGRLSDEGSSKSILHPDNTTFSTVYLGNCVTLKDEQNHERINCSDALGRLDSVTEDPGVLNYSTTYTYNPLDDLLTVAQGSETRTYGYDFLSRLTSASNPESGTTSYNYDGDGNVTARTDARGISTYYGYDALNRLTWKDYTDGITPSYSYVYDLQTLWGRTAPNALGHLSIEQAQPVTNIYNTNPNGQYADQVFLGFDAMGRPLETYQCGPSTCYTNGSIYDSLYTYNDMGSPLSLTTGLGGYPGRKISYSYDGVDRLNGVTSTLVDSNHPANLLSNFSYGPVGLTGDKLGNGVSETLGYNKRTWLNAISSSAYNLSGVTYYGNGNLNTASDSVNGNWTYTYDAVNRLWQAYTTSGKSLTYGYDQFGNASCLTGSQTTVCNTLSFTSTTNRLSGYSYDAAGNLLSDGTCSYTYDGEERVNTATCPGMGTTTYFYDAEGRRNAKAVGNTVTEEYVYNQAGQIVSVYGPYPAQSWLRDEIYAGNRHVATYANGTTYFTHADWLGTERARTDMTGNVCGSAVSQPFGDNAFFSGCFSESPNFFTGKQTDPESGLDYFGARFDANRFYRFLTPDPDNAGADPSDPQTWNAYAYVRNNPATDSDPTGMACVQGSDGNYFDDNSGGQTCAQVDADNAQQKPSVTVSGSGISDGDYLAALAVGAQRSQSTVNGLAVATGVVTGLAMLPAVGGGTGLTLLRLGPLIPAAEQFSEKEQAIVEWLRAAGNVVTQIQRIPGQKTADALVNGVSTEFKTLSGAGPNTLKNLIEEASEQGQNIIIDARNVTMSAQNALNQIARAQGNVGGLQGRVTVLTNEGVVNH